MMAEVAGSEFELPCEMVLIAAGFLGSQKYVTDAFGVEVDARTNVKTAPDAFATSVPKVLRQATCTSDSRLWYVR